MKHPCHTPLPIPAMGMLWSCPDCGDRWYVTDKGWISGAHWERVDNEIEEHVDQVIAWVQSQGGVVYPWQERIIRTVAYQNGKPRSS